MQGRRLTQARVWEGGGSSKMRGMHPTCCCLCCVPHQGNCYYSSKYKNNHAMPYGHFEALSPAADGPKHMQLLSACSGQACRQCSIPPAQAAPGAPAVCSSSSGAPVRTSHSTRPPAQWLLSSCCSPSSTCTQQMCAHEMTLHGLVQQAAQMLMPTLAANSSWLPRTQGGAAAAPPHIHTRTHTHLQACGVPEPIGVLLP